MLKFKQLDSVYHSIPMPNSMGIIRYLLALAIISGHYLVLNGNKSFSFILYTVVGSFFSLSGFLIINSFYRKKSISDFFKSRFKRLMPSYICVVLLQSILLYFISNNAFIDYFTSSSFWKYIVANMTMLNFLQPTIDGVFDNNVIDAINGSLWTMKVEWMLYISFPIIMLLIKRFNWNILISFSLIYALSVVYRVLFLHLYASSGNEIYNILSRQFIGQFTFFSAGIIIYILFDKIMKYRYLILPIALFIFIAGKYIDVLYFACEPFVTALLVIVTSMTGNVDKIFGQRANLSYNMYLTHYPIIQTFIATGLVSMIGLIKSYLLVILCVLIVSAILEYIIQTIQSLYTNKKQNPA